MKSASVWLALFPLCWAMLLTGCYTPASVACEGEPGGYCKQGYVCTKKKPFRCVLEGDLCGNGEIDGGEQCDDGNREAGDGCSPDCLSNYLCGNAVVDSGMGGAVAEECDPKEDNESAQAQGKDKPATDSSSTCDADCTKPACGDAFVNAEFVAVRHQGASGEECDPAEDDPTITPTDGKPQQAKGDSKKCNYDCTEAACGDGYVNKKFPIKDFRSGDRLIGEECDPGAEPGSTSTTSGVLERASANTAGCDLDCTKPLCGDGLVNQFFQIEQLVSKRQLPGEECDPGEGEPSIGADPTTQRATGDSATCDKDCTVARCGDGYVNEEAGEECDPGTEGNDLSSPGDPSRASADGANGCLATCKVGFCGDKHINKAADEECDDGKETKDCSADCKSRLCGNDRRDTGEECDGTPDCSTDCTIELCGNNNLDDGETCDIECDFALFPSGCVEGDCVVSSLDMCEPSRCGDGFLNSTGIDREQCDATVDLGPQPAPVASATCTTDCTISMCGDGVRNDQAEIWPIKGTSASPVRVGSSAQSGGEECEPTASSNPQATLADPFLATIDSERCDRDCTLASCGDGYLNESAHEECDGGAQDTPECNGPAAGEDLRCQPALCGDGYANASSESCDPGTGTNTSTGPGTSDPSVALSDAAGCDYDCSPALCGDGYANSAKGELCDPDTGWTANPFAASSDGPTCDSDCSPAACGDGRINTEFVHVRARDPSNTPIFGEECDPGTLSPTATSADPMFAPASSDTCDLDCTPQVCGDGYTNPLKEECDSAVDTADCDSDCTLPFCGDGHHNPAFVLYTINEFEVKEACDPGNGPGLTAATASADGQLCDKDCSPARCTDGYVNEVAGEAEGCETQWSKNTRTRQATAQCDTDCSAAMCGDGEVNGPAGETCDPDSGETTDPDIALADVLDCDADCTAVACGDGHWNSVKEACDASAGQPAGMPACDGACTPL